MSTLSIDTPAPRPEKLKLFAYWGTTALTAFAFLTGGLADLARGPAMVSGMAHLGYPSYFMLILGAWKVLGAVAIVAPRFPRLKEWAYAGMAFDLTGAALSHAAVGDPASKVLVPLLILGIAAASWALRPAPSGRALRPAPLAAHA
jgi:uncharacterized membrane protein YphA (DoxX/SURF4 family)